MTENELTPPPAKPAVKPRNPIEKALVRGFIGVMLVVVCIEGYSWLQWKRAMAPLLDRIREMENGANTPPLVEADVKAAVGSKPVARTEPLQEAANGYGASRLDVYSWFTLSPVKARELYVYYRNPTRLDKSGPEVVAVQTDGEIPTTVTPRPMTAKEKVEWEKAKAIMEGNPGGPPGIGQFDTGPPDAGDAQQ